MNAPKKQTVDFNFGIFSLHGTNVRKEIKSIEDMPSFEIKVSDVEHRAQTIFFYYESLVKNTDSVSIETLVEKAVPVIVNKIKEQFNIELILEEVPINAQPPVLTYQPKFQFQQAGPWAGFGNENLTLSTEFNLNLFFKKTLIKLLFSFKSKGAENQYNAEAFECFSGSIIRNYGRIDFPYGRFTLVVVLRNKILSNGPFANFHRTVISDLITFTAKDCKKELGALVVFENNIEDIQLTDKEKVLIFSECLENTMTKLQQSLFISDALIKSFGELQKKVNKKLTTKRKVVVKNKKILA